ncbi:MAG TPA: TIGR04283 family arsenosugar biosynthesis glycosyltransferase [Phycisphaerae bacterium]
MVFTRFPVPGRTKTRLIPALGNEGAALLQRGMTLHTLAIADQFQRARGRDGVPSVEVRYEDGSAALMRAAFGPQRVYRRQPAGDLGTRLQSAFAESFARGARSVIAIGSDCPALEPVLLEQAFAALRTHDLVLGPARDGGYYLIGLTQPRPELFQDIAWGTEHVCEQTRTYAQQMGLVVHLLPVLDDVDEPADLPHWQRHRGRYLPDARAPRISVIIPTLNEEECVARAIASAATAAGVEVIVADAGHDRTGETARTAGATVIRCGPGRGRQMNCAARAARGDVLLFLHADTTLPENYADDLLTELSAPRVSLVAFPLRIEPANGRLHVIEALANFRARWLGWPYGDQALSVRAETFRALRGFCELPLMEDLDFVRRARRLGRVAVLSSPVRTSARRWLANGIIRTTLVNQACIIVWRLGLSVDRLARWRRPRCADVDGRHVRSSRPRSVSGRRRAPE